MCTAMSLQNVTLISMLALILFFVSLSRGDFLIRSGGLKVSFTIPSQNVKLILRGVENSFKSSMVFVTKTKYQFLPLAAIRRKIKHSFISFLFHVPATLKDDTVFSCDARIMGCENICDILADIFGCHSLRLAIIAGVGRRALFIEKGA